MHFRSSCCISLGSGGIQCVTQLQVVSELLVPTSNLWVSWNFNISTPEHVQNTTFCSPHRCTWNLSKSVTAFWCSCRWLRCTSTKLRKARCLDGLCFCDLQFLLHLSFWCIVPRAQIQRAGGGRESWGSGATFVEEAWSYTQQERLREQQEARQRQEEVQQALTLQSWMFHERSNEVKLLLLATGATGKATWQEAQTIWKEVFPTTFLSADLK